MNSEPACFVLDTGALIALEGGPRKARLLWEALTDDNQKTIVPAVVLVEWWREKVPEFGKQILEAVEVKELLTLECAKKAGIARSQCGGNPPSAVDAVVMALADELGAVVYTTDLPDLQRLKQFFPAVKLLSPE